MRSLALVRQPVKENENFDFKTIKRNDSTTILKKRCNNSKILKNGKLWRDISKYALNENRIKNVKIVIYASKPNRVITRGKTRW